ncbi:MAG: Uma2 family endonuclease [Planctomycetes bacterium]|nr:Uma2 family endonuclease [Planctomycetota bacterium]
MSTALQTAFTPEDLLRLPDDGKVYELVDGQLVEKGMGAKSSWVGGKIHARLNAQEELGHGWAFPADTGFQCFSDDQRKVRKPDAAFIRRGRLPAEQLPEGFFRIAPNIAAEVVSPNDLFYEVEEKVAEYLAAGVELVWVANPANRTIYVHQADARTLQLTENDELTGGNVLPEFRCRVGDLFPPAPAKAPHEATQAGGPVG